MGTITLKTIALCLLINFIQVNCNPSLFNSNQSSNYGQQQSSKPELAEILNYLRVSDTCKAIYSSKSYGYGVLEYTTRTHDNYILRLHRLIHPSESSRGPPKPGAKKPYILLHGLIGSSASFVRYVQDNYQVPNEIFDIDSKIEQFMEETSRNELDYLREWQSTADHFQGAYDEDVSVKFEGSTFKERLLKAKPMKKFATISEINTDQDTLNFGRHFKKVHKKYELPLDSKKFITNSLAFTLSNFGYDVWLVNLRGNYYSRDFNGRHSADQPESPYWNFNIDTLVREDLMAAINHVRQVSQWREKDPIGLVSYSYSNVHVLNLLTNYPAYQDSLQPVVMLAPTLFTASVKDNKFKLMMNGLKRLLSKNGPFPNRLGKSIGDRLRGMLCHLPVAKEFCRLLEMVLFGKTNKVTDVLSIADDKKTSIIKQDMDCGQTSLSVLHQILENISKFEISPNYQPWISARNKIMKRQPIRRSVVLVHSEADEIATPREVEKIKDSALKMLVLADYSIKEPTFSHTDFLFSRRNRYLVNGEIARMVGVFDFLLYRKLSNQVTDSFKLTH